MRQVWYGMLKVIVIASSPKARHFYLLKWWNIEQRNHFVFKQLGESILGFSVACSIIAQAIF